MDDDEPFLLALDADPADDLTRLVYADWLEERGEIPRPRYLRLVATLAGVPEDEITESAAHDEMLALTPVVDPDWESRAGRRFEFAILECPSHQEARAVPLLAQLLETGDYDRLQDLLQSAPVALAGPATYRDAYWLFSRWQVLTRHFLLRARGALRAVRSPHPPGTVFDVELRHLPPDFWPNWAPVYKFPVSELLDLPPREAADRLRHLPVRLRQGLTAGELGPALRDIRRAFHRHWGDWLSPSSLAVIPRPPA